MIPDRVPQGNTTRTFGEVLPLPNHDDPTADGGAPEPARAGLAGQTPSSAPDDPSSREAGERPRRTHHTDGGARERPQHTDGPPPPTHDAASDEPTAVMPKRQPAPCTAGPDTPTTAGPAPDPRPPVLTTNFPGVLPLPRGRDDEADADGALEEGARVGGYVLGRRLAQRPTADVFAADHAQHGACALQVLTPAMSRTWAGRNFLLDARARTTLDDPRLARVVGVGDAPRPWVAMERLRGPSLRQVLDQEGALPLAEAARIARELTRGLARAHARRIVHGDLTPRDVRLEGERRAVKVTGFGVPKAIGPTGTRHAYSGGPALGEAPYAAPELFQGDRPTMASDVWAVGVLLHEMLAGRPPFLGSAREVMEGVLRGTPPTLEAERPDVPTALATIVRRCLARDPAERFTSAQDLAAALHEAAPERDDAGRRRSPGLLVVVLAVASALAAALATWALLRR